MFFIHISKHKRTSLIKGSKVSSNLVSIELNKQKSLNWQAADLNTYAANFGESSNKISDSYNKYGYTPEATNYSPSTETQKPPTQTEGQKEHLQQVSKDVYEVQNAITNIKTISDEVKTDVDKLDEFITEHGTQATNVLTALSPIVPFRRVTSVPNKIKDKDYSGALISLGVAATLFPEDLRDMRDAIKQLNHLILPKKLKDFIKNKNPKIFENFVNYAPKYDCKEFQVPFSFVRGSFLENFANKFVNKFGYAIHKNDTSLFFTKFGQKVQKFLNIDINEQIITTRHVLKVQLDKTSGTCILTNTNPVAYSLKGNKIGKLICRAMQRTTLYGTLAACLVSLPSIVKAFNKPKETKDKFSNAAKQTAKAAISIATGISGIAVGGALLASTGPLGSVIGMGLGCTLSSYIAKNICKIVKLDKDYT